MVREFSFEKENFEVSYEVEQIGEINGFCDYEQFIELECIVMALRENTTPNIYLCNCDVLTHALIMFQTGTGYEISGVYQEEEDTIEIKLVSPKNESVEFAYYVMAILINGDIKIHVRSEESREKFIEVLNTPEDIFLSTLEDFYNPHSTISTMKTVLENQSQSFIEEFYQFCCDKLFISLEGEDVTDSLVTIYEFMVIRYSDTIVADWR